MNPTNEKWLTKWRLAELRDQGWWVSDWLKEAFPADWCDRIDQQFPLPRCPQRWESFKLLLGTEGLICRREDVTPGLWEEAKLQWDRADNHGHIGMINQAMAAERAECDILSAKRQWRGQAGKKLLQLLRHGLPHNRPKEIEEDRALKSVLLKYTLIRFWIIGSNQVQSRLPLALCSDSALERIARFLKLDFEGPTTLQTARRRLGLRPAVPNGRLVRTFNPQTIGGRRILIPEWGGSAVG